MLVVLWAGQFNTGSALFWNMFYILKHTDVREKVEKEIQTVLTSLKDKTDPGTIKPKITLDDILKIEKQDLNKFVILGENIQDLMRQRGLTLIRWLIHASAKKLGQMAGQIAKMISTLFQYNFFELANLVYFNAMSSKV